MKPPPLQLTCPRIELEIYAGLVKNCIHQLGILKTYDKQFIFLETALLQHHQQVEDSLELLKAKGKEHEGT